jgi:hypothetical protein
MRAPETEITRQWPSNGICFSLACVERRIMQRGDVTFVYDDQARMGIVCEPECRGIQEGH